MLDQAEKISTLTTKTRDKTLLNNPFIAAFPSASTSKPVSTTFLIIIYDFAPIPIYAPSISFSLTAVLIPVTLFPHCDLADFHLASAWCSPGWIPLIPRIPEVSLGGSAAINPRLSASTIFEPTVVSTNSDVQDEVEFLVEGSLFAASLGPAVDQASAVAVRKRELSTLPEGLVEVRVEDLEEDAVDVGEKVLLRPLETEGVFGCSVCGVESTPLHVRAPPGIVGWVWTPV